MKLDIRRVLDREDRQQQREHEHQNETGHVSALLLIAGDRTSATPFAVVIHVELAAHLHQIAFQIPIEALHVGLAGFVENQVKHSAVGLHKIAKLVSVQSALDRYVGVVFIRCVNER